MANNNENKPVMGKLVNKALVRIDNGAKPKDGEKSTYDVGDVLPLSVSAQLREDVHYAKSVFTPD